MVSLPRLQHAADLVAAGDDTAIKELLSAGTGSLGGAHPKAAVRGDDGRLLMAKFTRPGSSTSSVAWEHVALQLAADAGIAVSGHRLARLSHRPVLLLDRFDRGPGDERIGYMSAMTATERSDGELGDYLDIVDAIEDLSADWVADKAGLFRRVVFSVLIHNTDDHLRNHGFLRSAPGWRLSPAFDINPNPDLGTGRQTAILGAVDIADEPAAVLEFAGLCGLDRPRAAGIIVEVARAVAGWQRAAGEAGISVAEQRRFVPAFEAQRDAFSRLLEDLEPKGGGSAQA
ncbi:HipA domain-containing protein [Brevibacterium sp. 50QC2O2]|uniref:type II toxin-antitoxin system HipA family toxin n=1 Tax=Brevibacterium sp. 50QC2O2 TaxID=2968459 RepID=UPI00211C33A4|nr:HipA domain-containing protein [Brevibacterium sp. 50QC2O2]MCQ9387261.1 HipA domain-containing protein [Brevibacterium sp. 50QC2O2]